MLWLVPSPGGVDIKHFTNMGLIVSPLNCLGPVKTHTELPFAIDNGAYGGKFNPDKFERMIHGALPYQSRCLFIVAPDVLCDPSGTNKLWHEWQPLIKRYGFKVAYVLQDGAVELPDGMDTLFIGGSTEYKMGDEALSFARIAKSSEKWVHVGRVNSWKRIRHFWLLMDSFDGTDWCRSPRNRLKFYQRVMAHEESQSRWGELVG